MPDASRTRHPFVALCLSFIAPGLGQFYNGQLKKAAVVLAVNLVALMLLFTPLPKDFSGFAFLALLWIGSYLYSLLDSSVRAFRIKRIRSAQYQRWYSYLAIILVCWTMTIILLRSAPIKSFEIVTVSMEPTLYVGDLCIADMEFYSHHRISQGELAVFSYPYEPSVSYMHRCLSTGGQTVEIRDRIASVDGKNAWVPGKYLGFFYPIRPPGDIELNIFPANAGNGDNYGPVVVPQGKCFMLGDNIANCRDSRYKGFVDQNKIAGKPLFVYWSSDRSRIGILLR